MKKLIVLTVCIMLTLWVSAQGIAQRIQKAYAAFEADSQMRHASSSLYVIDVKTGSVVFDKNSQMGLAPASTQKIITASTAFEILGKNFRYKTEFGVYHGGLGGTRLWINPSGDPTFGSWRWQSTGANTILGELVDALKTFNFKDAQGIMMNTWGWEYEQTPDGWIWQDVGNYYGAGAEVLNWRENQYDLILKSGNYVGAPVDVVGTFPNFHSATIASRATSADKSSGDNAYIYMRPFDSTAIVRGTIPINEDHFKIAGSMANPGLEFAATLLDSLRRRYGWFAGDVHPILAIGRKTDDAITPVYYTHYSPSLDSIVYWFLQKSINLYGEALLKTIAHEKKGAGSTDSGVALVQEFWKQRGIDPGELNIMDGSGLSPQNRVTTHAQVEVLKYARSRDWFPAFYAALPVSNGMKMKSGSIRDVKGYCGYQKSADGKEYIFSFLVNNYTGPSSSVINKMFSVLNELK